MIYSCFNAPLGMYEYFEDNRQHPTNGDLPVPKLPPQTGRIGVPAMDAGRPLPRDAKRAGTGWEARGMIVNCKPMATAGLSGIGQMSAGQVAILAAGSAAGAWYESQRDGNPLAGAIAGAILAAVTVYILE